MADQPAVSTPPVTAVPELNPDGTAATPVAPPQTVSAEELAKITADYEAKLERVKAGQAGASKLADELKAKVTELEKKGMSDKERGEYERKLFENEKADLERQKKQLQTESLKNGFMLQNQIPLEWQPFINAETEDGLKAQAEQIKALIEKATAPLKLELDTLKAGATRPGGGAPPAGPQSAKAKMLEAQARFKEATEKGDIAAQKKAADESFYWQEAILKGQ